MPETTRTTVGGTSISVTNPWLFFAVTFALTWSFWLPALVLGLRFDSLEGISLLLTGLAAPGIAGIGFTYLVYDDPGRKDYWDRLTNVRRVGVKWFLVVLLLFPALNLLAAGLDLLLGGTGATWSEGVQGFTANPLSLLPAIFFVTLPPFVEELGWRGYALDRLQMRWSALSASLILGVVWSVWHLPLFFVAGSYQQGLGVGTLEFWLFVVGIVFLSVSFSWVYNNMSRSILAIILLHSMVNFSGEVVQITRNADAIFILLQIAFAVVLAAVWSPATLNGTDDVPRPPLPERR